MNVEKTNSNHPVWDIYDEFRTARLNKKYYIIRANQLNKINFWMEFIIAFSASSTVVGLWFWQSALGGYAWKSLGLIVAILSIIKPMLKLSEKMTINAERVADYTNLDHEFQKLTLLIRQNKKCDTDIQQQFIKIFDKKGDIIKKYGEIVKKYGGEKLNRKIILKCSDEVNCELPINKFYTPKED